MASQIDELVRMRDVETLYELMTEDEEWMTQLDAAEGLVRLGDRRGYEFLLSATMSDDESILEVAQEILDSPDFAKMRDQIEEERETGFVTKFEREFGRPLSPMECEILVKWLDEDKLSDDLILAALKEAVFAGKLNFKYIDRILFEWKRNRVETVEQAKQHASQFRKKGALYQSSGQKRQVDDFPFYNWLQSQERQ